MNCHNGETYLKESISSPINQTYKNLELVLFFIPRKKISFLLIDKFL